MVTSLKLAEEVVADALGLPAQTVVQHLRNLQKQKLITFKGYGRGAAQMKPIDAARLLIASAGADQVKDSLAARSGFGELLPIGSPERAASRITLEDHVAAWLTELASGAYATVGGRHEGGCRKLGLSLMSFASNPSKHPRVAIARWGGAAIAFGSPGWATPVSSSEDFAATAADTGLIREKHIPIGAMRRIAGSL